MMAARGETATGRVDDLREIETLGQALRFFLTCAGPMTMALFCTAATIARFGVFGDAPFGRIDALLVLGVVLLWWFQEWFLHVTVLHMKPRKIGRFVVDPAFSRTHRHHHREPWHPVLVFVPLVYVVLGFVVSAALFALILPRHLAATALMAYCAMGVLYEWTHYIVHTRYKPRTRFVKALWRNHRLHHFKNENYWFGLSVTWVDDLLGTAPNHREIETSATCRMTDREI